VLVSGFPAQKNISADETIALSRAPEAACGQSRPLTADQDSNNPAILTTAHKEIRTRLGLGLSVKPRTGSYISAIFPCTFVTDSSDNDTEPSHELDSALTISVTSVTFSKFQIMSIARSTLAVLIGLAANDTQSRNLASSSALSTG